MKDLKIIKGLGVILINLQLPSEVHVNYENNQDDKSLKARHRLSLCFAFTSTAIKALWLWAKMIFGDNTYRRRYRGVKLE